MPDNHLKGLTLQLRSIALCLTVVLPLTVHGGAPTFDAKGIERLRQDIGGPVHVSNDRATGTVSFLRFEPGTVPLASTARVSPNAATMAFARQYASIFGLQHPERELQFVRESDDAYGFKHAVYRQVYEGVPVFASDFRGHFDPAGELTAISASTLPVKNLNPVPSLDAAAAGALAIADTERTATTRIPPDGLEANEPELVVYRSGLIQGTPGRNHLAWKVEVLNSARTIREFVFVDAHDGEVIDRFSGVQDALHRTIYNDTTLAWEEGDPLPFTGKDATDVNHLIDFAEDSYNLFLTMSGGLYASYDGADAIMQSILNNPVIACPNANWDGLTTNYCAGVTGDDTVAHEWTHAYTEYTHNLVYAWQPGALNESFSDIFGEVVDELNGAGTDSPDTLRTSDGSACSTYGAGTPSTDNTYRWLSGEDDTAFGGAIRDLWRPECYGDPGRVSSSNYWCLTGDGGGVHTNSGVPNHLFALAVDGGSFNSQLIAGLGLTKAAQIYWRAMTTYQGPASDFADHADALEASCSDLVGQDLPALQTDSTTPVSSGETITSQDCTELSKAIDAVELRTEPSQCPFEPVLQPNPLPLCYGQGDLNTFSLTDWESGLGSWSSQRHDVANLPTFDTDYWAVVGSLPDARPGSAAFVADLVTGDCAADDESGALNLDSPPIVIPAGTVVPRVAIDHWIASELDWDGGNFKVSVNGQPFVEVPLSAIDLSPYNDTLATLAAGNSNPLEGEPAFTGTDEGQIGGSWGQSIVNLYGIAKAGDTVRFRFDFGVDGCNGAIGWYVDDVRFYSCSDELPPSDCGNSVLDAGEECDDGNVYNGDGCSNICQVEDGWQCSDPTPAGEILDPGFEGGTPNPVWTESSTNFGTPICSVDVCGTGSGTGPANGTYWAWFGGWVDTKPPYNPDEEASLSQSVVLPSTATTLEFALEANACDSSDDFLEILIDGSQAYEFTGADPLCGAIGYTVQSVDISAYADGAAHTVELHGHTQNTNGDVSNFFVDDLAIPGKASVCTPTVATTTLTLVKKVVNDNGGTAAVGDFGITTSAGSLSFGAASGSGTIADPFVYTSTALTVDAGVPYSLSESDVSGYTEGSWSCDGNQGGGGGYDSGLVTLDPGEDVTCTISNNDDAPSLTIVKKIVNDNGGTAVVGDFGIATSAGSLSFSAPGGSGTVADPYVYTATPLTNLTAGQAYTLYESNVAGYDEGAWSCSPNAGGGAYGGGSVTLALGENATCIITNNDISPTLILEKTVVNDNGGTLTQDDFPAFVDSSPQAWDDTIAWPAGAHTVSETPQEGYAAGDWGGDCAADGSITLSPGQTAVCTITNDDISPSLTLKKTVLNDDGGSLTQDDFPAFVDDSPQAWDAVVLWPAGPHTVSETSQAGYAAGDWGGDCAADGSITLSPGQNAVCTVTNDDTSSTLTLKKTVINDNGGTLTQDDFPAFVDDSPQAWDAVVARPAGAHTVSETPQTGYAAGGWSGDCAADGSITLSPGQDAVCTITNDDVGPTLKLVKTVVNDNGGSLAQSDFPAFVDDAPQAWDAVVVWPAGAHTVSEATQAGYAAGDWGGDCAADGSITLSPGQNAICTVTNDDIPEGEHIFLNGFEQQ